MEILNKYSSSELRALIKKQSLPIFDHLGFFRSGEFYVKEFKDGVFGFIFLSISSLVNNELCVMMHLGIDQKDVVNLIGRLLEIKIPKKPICNNWRGITDIIPDSEYLDYEWKVKSPSDVDSMLKSMLQVINQWVLPFFEENCNMEKFKYNVYSKDFVNISWRDIIIPVLYYLDGKKDKGEEYIKNRLESSEGTYSDTTDKVFLKNYFELEWGQWENPVFE